MAHPPPYEPFYLSAPPPEYNYAAGDRNGINTLFVSGLPDDVKAREIHNLFRRRPGFESCQLKYTGRGNQVVAFATFVNPQSAMAALHSLNGAKFDPQTGSTLHIELARSNSRRKLTPGSGPYVVIDRRTNSETDARESSSEDGDGDSDEPASNPDDGHQDNSAAEKSSEQVGYGNDVFAPESEQVEKAADGACSTLFIANLGPNCTDEELKQVLSQYQGFSSLKVRARGGMPVAFCDFERIEQATEAMNALQGSTLSSSDRGGMHIEYPH
ncbi:RNA-binding family protein [Perilla frutescens var. frutescens]|nr:RNA-binding family protein [Perilla frutescens var. frutescens]